MDLNKDLLLYISSISDEIDPDNHILYIFKENEKDDMVIQSEKNINKFKKNYILCVINKINYDLDLDYNVT